MFDYSRSEEEFIGLVGLLCKRVYQDNEKKGFWQEPRTVAHCLALIHSELSEALEGDRKGSMDDHLPQYSSLTVELADAVIRIMDLAGHHELPLGQAIIDKIMYNRNRPAKHGKKY